jgi:hypothetical protein
MNPEIPLAPETEAWINYQATHPTHFRAASLGCQNADEFLRNRLEAAYLSGIAAGQKIERARIAAILNEK